jgi:hypothetical protein
VPLLRNSVFADVINFKKKKKSHSGLDWALNPIADVLIGGGKDT